MEVGDDETTGQAIDPQHYCEGTELLELNRIILKACENNPDNRFRSAADLQAALAELLRRIH